MLQGYPIQISVYIILAIPAQLHALLPAQTAVARGDVDIQVLLGILVIHVKGHVEIHAAHQINGFLDRADVHHRAAIRVKACQRAHAAAQSLQAAAPGVDRAGVDAVDFPHLPWEVYISISRDTDKVHPTRLGVNTAHQDRVGVAAYLVQSGEDQRKDAAAALGCSVGLKVLFPGDGSGGLRGRLRGQYRRGLAAGQSAVQGAHGAGDQGGRGQHADGAPDKGIVLAHVGLVLS